MKKRQPPCLILSSLFNDDEMFEETSEEEEFSPQELNNMPSQLLLSILILFSLKCESSFNASDDGRTVDITENSSSFIGSTMMFEETSLGSSIIHKKSEEDEFNPQKLNTMQLLISMFSLFEYVSSSNASDDGRVVDNTDNSWLFISPSLYMIPS